MPPGRLWGSRGIDGHGSSSFSGFHGARLRGAAAGVWQGVQVSLEAVGDVGAVTGGVLACSSFEAADLS